MLLAGTAGPERILAKNFDTCWRQAAIFYFAKLFSDGQTIVVDLRPLPKDMPNSTGTFILKIRSNHSAPLRSQEAKIVSDRLDHSNIRTLKILPDKGKKRIRLLLPV